MEEALTGHLEGRNTAAVAGRLRAGGVAVLPTDTIYGFHCVCSSVSSIDRIRKIKGRSRSAGFILLASTIEMADTLVSKWPPGVREAIDSLWPAPVTAILPASKKIAPALRPGGGVAVRIPAMPSLLRLIEMTGEPLLSTSVNRSGSPPMNRIGEIEAAFPGLEAYMSRRGGGGRIPSTVVDLKGRRPRLLRSGRDAEKVAAAFGIDLQEAIG
jgi:tRNA threonylcarbamoyl adenosine modification protein (Sua5/YciO/YrdC/YwlC family)